MGVHEEVRPHVIGSLLRHGGEEFLQFALGIPPREVAVALLETDGGQGTHDGGAGEGLREEDHVRIDGADLADQPLPELQRLGVGVVDPEDLHSLGHPVLHDPQHLGRDAVGVVVEVERVDVLVLLRRVLGVRDAAVGEGREPLGVLAHPGVVRGSLECEVECDFEAGSVCRANEGAEVGRRSQVRVDRVVTALGGADRIWGSGITRLRCEGVVAPLAVGGSDRMDRNQIDHVETHRGDLRQAFGCRANVPLFTVPSLSRFAPSDRGKNSYHAPTPAAARSTLSVCRSVAERRVVRGRARKTSASPESVESASAVSPSPVRSDSASASRRFRWAAGRSFSAAARASSSAPSAAITGTSTPAATFSSAAWAQVAKSSENASNR